MARSSYFYLRAHVKAADKCVCDELSSAKLWRFVDLGRRLDFLLVGFGWCRNPEHLIANAIRTGRLKVLKLQDDPTSREELTIHAAHQRHRCG